MINISKDKEDILHIEQAKNSLDEYKQQAKINMKAVFQLDTSEKEIPLNAFLENTDHGAKHSYQVFKKALEIAQDIQNKSDTSIDTTLLYIMSGMHDSGRFRIPITKDSDTTKQAQAKIQKNKKAERDHSRYGVAQIQL